jgi:hypothetical protein
MLFSGCCAVSVNPPVWVWNRQPPRLRVLRAVLLAHPPGPDPTGGAELRDLLEEVVVAVEEEGEPRREVVDVEAGGDPRLDVLEAVARG